MATAKLKSTGLECTNTESNSGNITFNTDSKFNFDQEAVFGSGLTTTGATIGENSSLLVQTPNYTNLLTTNLKLKDSDNSDQVTIKAHDTTTSHTLTLPATQGSANTYLKNDSSGNLSWNTIPIVLSGIATIGDIGGTSTTSTVSGDLTSASKNNNNFGSAGSTITIGWTVQSKTLKAIQESVLSNNNNTSENDLYTPVITSYQDGSVTLKFEESGAATQNISIMISIFY